MSIYLLVTHLPSGNQWTSCEFDEEQYSQLHALVYGATEMHFYKADGDRVYFPPGVLEQCVIEIRRKEKCESKSQ